MSVKTEHPVLTAFQDAARDVPAYARILSERGVSPDSVRNAEAFFEKVPVIDKHMTFGRFPVVELCRHGRLGRPASLLTSSGHSGQFAFGLYDQRSADAQVDGVDKALDMFFGVRRKSTLLINCLPMGVKVPTRLCTLAETSVRADMVTALVRAFTEHCEQFVLVGETAFIKHVLELGEDQGLNWHQLLIHVAVGEEMLAENARRYLEHMLGTDAARPEDGLVISSMGVAELGLNLFFELPELIRLRRAIHKDPDLRLQLTGARTGASPMVFTYDPGRIFVEVLPERQLVVTTLDVEKSIPLIRYRTGDMASLVDSEKLSRVLEEVGGFPEGFPDAPLILVYGRGKCASAGEVPIYPEEVKEGLYEGPGLARLTTANFRIKSGETRASVRIQLAPGIEPETGLDRMFADALRHYVHAPMDVKCQSYEEFGSGMALDYERKFSYLEG